jgi:hypothetical protein
MESLLASVRVVYRMSRYRHQIGELLISPLFIIENLVLRAWTFLLRIAIGSGQSTHLVFEELEVFPEAFPGQVAKIFIDLAGSAELQHFF